MFIMINDIIGEKTIYLFYPIYPRKEITVVGMISDNIQYKMKEPLVLKLMGNYEKRIPNGTYTIRENLIIPITSQMEDKAIPYLHILCLVTESLRILNQQPLNIRNSKMVKFFL